MTEKIKVSDFVFDYIQRIYNSLQKVTLNRGGLCIKCN